MYSRNVIRVIKSKIRNVRNANKMLVGRFERTRPLWRNRC